jgi:hypothetical protein
MKWWVGALLLLPLVLGSCGGSKKTQDAGEEPAGDVVEEEVETPDAEPDGEEDPAVDVEDEDVPSGPCPGGYVPEDAMNTDFMVAGHSRAFDLILPDGDTTGYGPWPIVFLWHEHELTPADMRDATGVALVAGDADFKFIAVLPQEAGFTLPSGLGWEMLQVEDPDTNPDVMFFDAMLACIDETFGVDEDRIYSVGFSTGAILSNLLAVVRNDVIAATVSYSGSYFSDPAQEKCLGTECTSWPAVETGFKFPTIVTEGGSGDYFDILGVLTLDFHADALATLDYLGALGHEVIYCPHTEGHVVPENVKAAQFAAFFRDHPKGTRPSPYASGLPGVFPGTCTYEPPD